MIELKGITKSYQTSHGRHYVFKDVNIVFPEGKSVGLIGRNGAGKTTLLRIIGGIDKPDYGRIFTQKTISWPVALSGGFQQSMTGRQNVKFVCRLYAKKSEIAEKVAFIQDFAELGKYFDMPIKSYSSGMRARLSFGLSMAFDFDYYLIDEVTSVGDASFKDKSDALIKNKMENSNIILVSHSVGKIKKFCNAGILIGRKEVTYYENIDEAIAAYQQDEADHQSSLKNK